MLLVSTVRLRMLFAFCETKHFNYSEGECKKLTLRVIAACRQKLSIHLFSIVVCIAMVLTHFQQGLKNWYGQRVYAGLVKACESKGWRMVSGRRNGCTWWPEWACLWNSFPKPRCRLDTDSHYRFEINSIVNLPWLSSPPLKTNEWVQNHWQIENPVIHLITRVGRYGLVVQTSIHNLWDKSLQWIGKMLKFYLNILLA